MRFLVLGDTNSLHGGNFSQAPQRVSDLPHGKLAPMFRHARAEKSTAGR